MLVSAGQYLFAHNFIYSLFLGCAGSPLLCRPSLAAAQALLTAGASRCGAWALRLSSFSSCGSGALEHRCGLRCSVACGIFPVQGSNPCLLHWQANSLRLSHQASPGPELFKNMSLLFSFCFSPFSGAVGKCDGLLQASVFQWDADLEALEGRGVAWCRGRLVWGQRQNDWG